MSRHHRRGPTTPRPLDADPFRKTALGLARNLIAGTTLRQLKQKHVDSMESNDLVQEMAGYGQDEADDDLSGQELRGKLRQFMGSKVGRPQLPRQPQKPVGANLKLVAKLLGLGPGDRAVLLFLLAHGHNEGVQELMELFGPMPISQAARLVAVALKASQSSVLKALSPRGRLLTAGMVHVDDRARWAFGDLIDLHPKLLDLVLRPGLDRRRFVERFLPGAGAGELTRDDFPELEQATGLARDLLEAELRQRRGGVNILLHGPTGTGKTELARALARDLGAELYAAGQTGREGHSPAPEQRLASLLLGQRLMAREKALLLFDELEDLFDWRMSAMMGGGPVTAHMSKQWFNRQLEGNPVPTIWITNATAGIDPAFLRRFTYAVELDQPGTEQRARVLRRHLGDEVVLEPGALADLARRHPVSPGQLAGAVRSAVALDPEGPVALEMVERILEPVERLLTGDEAAPRELTLATGEYDLGVVNCDTDLEALAGQLEQWQEGSGQGVTLCLHGVPGTGKSELVAYLARRTGRELHRHLTSDLLSKWVGGTEQRIASAFRRAEKEGAVLLLDEADSFLRDRRGAERSWEVTQVNELLQQLERFRGIAACTTNLMGDLDAAAMRRFVFKIEFSYLRPEQARTMARNTLAALGAKGDRKVVARIGELGSLTPGDFAAVARRLRALGASASGAGLLEGLRGELSLKETPAASIGFGR